MDEDLEKVNLSALRKKFEKDASARHVDKRQTVFEVSTSQFASPGKPGTENLDVVQHRANKIRPPVTPRRSSEADMINKPAISPKPVWVPKKPEVGSMPQIRTSLNPAVNLTGQKKGLGVVEKHAKLFEQSGLSPAQSDNNNTKATINVTPSQPVLSKVEPSVKPEIRVKPLVSPRSNIKSIITCPEWSGSPRDGPMSVQSKKEMFENVDQKPALQSKKEHFQNVDEKPAQSKKDIFANIDKKPFLPNANSAGGEDKLSAFSSVIGEMKSAANCDKKQIESTSISGPASKAQTPPPPKPNRTFAHDIYQQGKVQRMSALSMNEPILEKPGDDVFVTVDFRTRGVIVGEEDSFIPRDRLDTDMSQNSLDLSLHDYEDVESPTSLIPPPSPGGRPALPLPTGRQIFTPVSLTNINFLSSDDYSLLEHQRIRSWDTGTSSMKSNKSQLSQRSNSDECLYSRTYEVSKPAEYIDPADLFTVKPKSHVRGFPDVVIDDYGYAVPHHTNIKTPVCMSRSLDGVKNKQQTKFLPPSHPPPGIPKDKETKDLKRQKVVVDKKKKVTSPNSEEWDNFPVYVRKDDHAPKTTLDYVKTYRRKPVVRQKIGQAFSILRRNVEDDVDGDYQPPIDWDDDRQSNESESQIDIKELQRRIRHVTSIKEKNQSIYERVRAFRERIYPQLFDYAVIVGLEMVNGQCQPVVLHKFPHHCDPEKTSIPEFCFPDKDVLMPVTKYDSENFSFVLTSCEGRRDYGYCKRMLPPGRGARLPEVICIISPLGAHTLYSQVLDHAEKRRHVSNDYVMELIAATYGKPLPCLGRSIDVNSMNTQGALETITLSRHEDTRMENVNFEYLFSCLGTENVLQVFSAILLERRTLFSASKLSTLSNCIHALAGLLYPFQWQHTFIPVLPAALLDITCAPTPYIIGIMSPNLPKIDDLPTEEVLIVDLDKACLLRKCDDETTIMPRKLQKALISALTMAMEDADGQKNVMISEAFVRLFVESIGHYEEHIGIQQDGKKVFQKDSFCKAVSSKSLQMFLEWFCETQMFHIFIDDHIDDGEQREKGLFDARITEYKQELASMPQTSWNNFREKLRNFGKAIKTNIKGTDHQKKKAT